METNVLWIVVLSLFAICIWASRIYRTAETTESPTGFLLADKALGQTSVTNLLLSSSFGVNAIFYAAWLGYSLGGWALLIQGCWALSFVLLARYSSAFDKIESLHDLLGHTFGTATKVIASLLSIIGILFFVGWEVGIAEGAVLELEREQTGASTPGIILAVIIGTLAYTIIGGMRGNAAVNILLNAAKILIMLALISFAIISFSSSSDQSFWATLFPPPEVLITNFGVWGLITNVLFNLSWQFVDNSSWQSVIAGVRSGQTQKHLESGGVWVFLSIGVLGTLYGASLTNIDGVNEGNIIAMMLTLSPENALLLYLAIQILLVTCMISLLDGMFLAIALTIAKDIFIIQRVNLVRFVLLPIIALGGIYGVRAIQVLGNIGLFDLVYVVVISQLALMGPVLVALRAEYRANQMWIALVVAFSVGIGSILTGLLTSNDFYLQSAGTFTLVGSIICATLIYWLGRRNVQSEEQETLLEDTL